MSERRFSRGRTAANCRANAANATASARRRTGRRRACQGGQQDNDGKHDLDGVERAKNQTADTEADLQSDIRRAELQRCFQKRDGRHHAKPDEDNRDGYGPRDTHVAGPLRRIMLRIRLIEDTLSDTEGGVGVRHTAVNSGL